MASSPVHRVGPSVSAPSVRLGTHMQYDRGDEEYLIRHMHPGTTFPRVLTERIRYLELENAQLRKAVFNLRTENCFLRTRLLQCPQKGECICSFSSK